MVMEAQESIITFDDYVQIIKRRWLPGLRVFVPMMLISLLIVSFKKPTYVAEGKLEFHRKNTLSSLTGVGTELGKLESLLQDTNNPLNTEAEVIRSTPIVQKTIEKLNLKNDKGVAITTKAFLENLTVSNIQKTDILKISYQDKNPDRAAQVVNTLMDIYLEYNISSPQNEAVAARKFLQQQIPNAELIVSKVESELRNFKEKNRVIALEIEANKAVEIISDLQKQIGDTQAQLANISSQSLAISQQLNMTPKEAILMTSINQSPGVQDILKEIQQLESKIAIRRAILQDNHPEILALKQQLSALNKIWQNRIIQITGTTQNLINRKQQIGALQQQLTAKFMELESISMGLNSELLTLYKLQNAYRIRLQNIPQLEQKQREIERKLQAAQSTYSLLLQKLQESRVAENQNLGNATKISNAQVPDEPSYSVVIYYLSAVLLSILATFATVYILEIKDKSIKSLKS
ncbi:GumC family protein [Anabaena sp. UHCC 0451]|uniref:GumC family protein n=1 Tax=Anabaena sp. UHCC 0451 TaxID=2055235 RepID=UPI002B1EFF8A|nr:GumC family protein [Anabaena sp. UHCC 0451]MEA5579057.1 GumC family protein [Anabaena sp. UHCC 0451]